MFSKTDVVYIAGPMTGKRMFNYPIFYGYAALIEKEYGCKVLNPARQPNGKRYEEYLRLAMEDVKQATAIVMLDGWIFSNGATSEYNAAIKRGVRIVLEHELVAALDEKMRKENANA